MPLTPGQSLSFYQILGPLGAGGMGEVYRARDTRLDREVAIKVLPEEFASDEERLRRFEREAKTLASLNHTNIGGIHGVDQVGDVCFLALELVPGEDLSERIARGALPVDEAVDICRQIAEGLEVAHEAGVIHRDLKPANVRITPEGVVKVLDFGLAKPIRPETTKDGTSTARSDSFLMTAEGLVLGTPTYMSPEQVKGLAVDRRTDVWAFGCVLFECLTGVRAFDADSVPELLASVLNREPDWSRLPTDLPPHLGLLLQRALTKDPRARLRDLGDARLELESGEERFAGMVATAANRGGIRAWALAGGGAALLAVGVFAGRALEIGRDAATRRFDTYVFTAVTDQEGLEIRPSLSPDGKQVVYSAQTGDAWEIYSQRVGGSRAQNLSAEIEGDQRHPALSPDGESIAFRSEHAGGGIFVMGATGESPRRVTDFGFDPAWSPDGTRLAFVTEDTDDPLSREGISQLFVAEVASGLTRAIEVEDAMQPAWSPDGRWIAYWAYGGDGQRDLHLVSPAGGTPVQLTDDRPTDWSPTWSPDGAELFFSSDRGGVMNLWRIGIDARTGAALGSPLPATQGVGAACGFAALSADGSRIAFSAATVDKYAARVAFHPESRKTLGLPERIPGTRGAVLPHSSPDGEWVLFHREGGQEDIFVVRPDGSQRRQLTDDVHKDRAPTWSPDGTRIFFFSDRTGLYQIWSCSTDGSDLVQHSDSDPGLILPVLSPDGMRMASCSVHGSLNFLDPHARAADQNPAPAAPFPDSRASLKPQGWSPDGRWLAIRVNLDGADSLALLDTDGMAYELVQQNAGISSWLPDSSGILYCTAAGVLRLWDLESRESVEFLQLQGKQISSCDVSPDGRWLYMTVEARTADIWVADLLPDDDGS